MYLLLVKTFFLSLDIEKDSVKILRFHLLIYVYIQAKYLLHIITLLLRFAVTVNSKLLET